ncbi:hypothetical protein YPPY66_1074 [Yersinia pestis PY-66]|uniref:Uncharacterized protein n=1 Tax=Yersinia pestis biovar Orientalis str. IP275 TaxID=373665 RepID=A0AAV3BAK0_YERPE|nr:hypothetical protein YPIP275_2272 [Yersinia pestis biovar Orientalis str. IP275]EDR40229.1 hypothetical protein YpF1991016_1322 [Yersinia pestis biovar Orientalis str. F1991016]EDR44337.1 hypothetical protein YpE1979001_2820 [Yersinia pestis biovar Antiqua str. E1979001]EDR50468.1 hypothetical protein YpB42003004_2943 [Yersinia pestis biovar Antiqua str. B42003004]EDR58842.1 hypothetical protein YpMG051020_1989 [Yersinia pestis biovar Orientalis str. MG05-1020]EDR65693.1 hypothetical protei
MAILFAVEHFHALDLFFTKHYFSLLPALINFSFFLSSN